MCVRRESSFSCRSVSAVPIEAATGSRPGLLEGEHVRVALDHDRALLLRHRRPRAVEPVEQVALAEELTLGRVDVLGAQRVVLAELPCLEPAHAPARVGERKEQPACEVVVTAPVDEAGRGELGAREPFLARLSRQRRAAGRQPEPVLAADVLAKTALLQVLARRLAGVGLPEVTLVEARRLLEQREQALAAAALGVALGRRLLVLQRHPEALGQELDRLREVELLGLADEADHVAARPAAEAVVELVGRVHGEARRPLVVERAEPGEARAGLAQLRSGLHDLDHVGRLDGLANRCVLDPGHQSDSA